MFITSAYFSMGRTMYSYYKNICTRTICQVSRPGCTSLTLQVSSAPCCNNRLICLLSERGTWPTISPFRYIDTANLSWLFSGSARNSSSSPGYHFVNQRRPPCRGLCITYVYFDFASLRSIWRQSERNEPRLFHRANVVEDFLGSISKASLNKLIS